MLTGFFVKYRRQLTILGLALGIVSGAFAYGFHRGALNQAEQYAEERIVLQEELLDLGKKLSLRNAQLLAEQAERQEMIDELEAQALSAGGADGPGVVSTGGLQRLCDRWGASC